MKIILLCYLFCFILHFIQNIPISNIFKFNNNFRYIKINSFSHMQKYKTQHKRGIVLFQSGEYKMDLPDTFLDRQTIEKYLCSTGVEKYQRRLVFFTYK